MKLSQVQADIQARQKILDEQAAVSQESPTGEGLANAFTGLHISLIDKYLSGITATIKKLRTFEAALNHIEKQDYELTHAEHLQFLYLAYSSSALTFKELSAHLQTVPNFMIYRGISPEKISTEQKDLPDEHKKALEQLLLLPPQLQTQAVFEYYFKFPIKTELITQAINTLAENERDESCLIHYCTLSESHLKGIIAHSRLSPQLRATRDRNEFAKHTELNTDFLTRIEQFVQLPYFLQTQENYFKIFEQPGISVKHLKALIEFFSFIPSHSESLDKKSLAEYSVIYQQMFDLLLTLTTESTGNLTYLWLRLKEDIRQNMENLRAIIHLGEYGVQAMSLQSHRDQFQFDKILIGDYLHKVEAATRNMPKESYHRKTYSILVELKEHIDTLEKSGRRNKAQAVIGIIKEISKDFSDQVSSKKPDLGRFARNTNKICNDPANKSIIVQHASAFSKFLRVLLEGLQYFCFGYGFYSKSNHQRGGSVQTTTAAKFHQLNTHLTALPKSP